MRGFAIRAHRDCPYQHFWYTHFGESLISQSSYSGQYSSPYRFNGKELDGETGLNYYGARYYEPKLSIWLSVDAMASSEHNIPLTPYHFSANNPVMIIDPDGNDWYRSCESGAYTWFDGSEEIKGYENKGESFTLGGDNNNQLSFTAEKQIILTTESGSETVISDYNEPQQRIGPADIFIDALLTGDNTNDPLPNPLDYLNGEEISINGGENFELMENKWRRVRNSSEYADYRKGNRRASLRTSGGLRQAIGDGRNGAIKGALGIGSLSGILGQFKKGGWSLWSVMVGGLSGGVNNWNSGMHSMEIHDALVLYHRRKNPKN